MFYTDYGRVSDKHGIQWDFMGKSEELKKG